MENKAPGSIQQVVEVPFWVKSHVTLDLERLADEFVGRIAKDVSSAMAFWRAIIVYVPKDLHGALGRLVSVRLNCFTHCALNSDTEGRALLFAWMVEKTRHPAMPKRPFPTTNLAYNFFGSLVAQYGSPESREKLRRGGLVLLGLRKKSWSLANKGRGLYSDLIVVLNGSRRTRNASVFPAATEPSAQYAHRAKPVGSGRLDPRYSGVVFKHVEGVDVNSDHIKDAGRLIEGTYKYFERPHGYLGHRAFKVHQTQIVERDTDGDGFFTEFDPNRVDKTGAQDTLLIHCGGGDNVANPNTWSAGCQTVPKNHYDDFLRAIGRPAYFYYVLVNAT